MSDFEYVSLSNLVEEIIDNRGRTCPTSEQGIPLIATNCIKEDRIYPTHEKVRYVSDETYREWFRGHPIPGDILFVNKGSPGRVCLVPDPIDFCIAQDMVALRANKRLVCPQYLFAALRSPQVKASVDNMHVGTMIPHFKKGDFDKLLIPVPDRGEQEGIGNIYCSFSLAIENKRKSNETLEAMAKALFKSWFVDFDPVRAKAEGRPTGLPAEISDLFPDSFEDSELGEIPSGWGVGEIDQILNLQKDSLDPATVPDEAFDHYSIPAFDAGKYPARELGSSIKSQKFLVGDGDLLVSKLNPSTPRVWIPFALSGRRAICSTEFLVCRTSSVFGRAYAYCLASSDAIVEAMTGLAGGTSNSHQRIRPGDFLALPCCIGSEMVRSAFLDVVEPLLGKSLVLRTESRSLSTTRDALLPKLISGEIRIPDAERMLEEVGL